VVGQGGVGERGAAWEGREGRGWLKAWMAERLGVRCGERASGVKSAWLGGREGKMTGCVAESGRSEVQPAGAARVMPTGKRPAPDGLEADGWK